MLNIISGEDFKASKQHLPTPETALITHPRRSLADMAWGVEENGNGDVIGNGVSGQHFASLPLYKK